MGVEVMFAYLFLSFIPSIRLFLSFHTYILFFYALFSRCLHLDCLPFFLHSSRPSFFSPSFYWLPFFSSLTSTFIYLPSPLCPLFFLITFANKKLPNVTITFATTPEHLEGFSWNLILEFFLLKYVGTLILINIENNNRYFAWSPNAYLRWSDWVGNPYLAAQKYEEPSWCCHNPVRDVIHAAHNKVNDHGKLWRHWCQTQGSTFKFCRTGYNC